MSFFDVYDLKSIENLDLLARKVVEGFIIGLHKSPFHGFSVEFAEHRLYNSGESTKNLDWKVYARSEKLFVKKYEEETNLRCQIVLDASSSMFFPKDLKIKNLSLNKFQYSALGAASLMNLLKRQRDAFGLSLFDTELKIHTPNKSSSTHYKLLLSYLENEIQRAALQQTADIPATLHQIADRVHKRSLIIIFSDFFDRAEDHEELYAALQHLNYNKHEVVVFHVMDEPLEMAFEFENRPQLFIDMETGEQIKLQSNELKSAYQAKIKEHQERIIQKCLQYKIDYVPTNIRNGYHEVLRRYLTKRSKISK